MEGGMTSEPGRSTSERPTSVAAKGAPVSVIVFTLNEEVNLPACLDSLRWCDDVIVVDSFSSDHTAEIARAAGARFFQHAFEGFGKQRNWAIDHTEPKHDWILILDADEKVPPELVEEMRQRLSVPSQEIGAYRLRRRFHMWGKWLKHSSLYPTWVVRLIHKSRVRYENRGHAETQTVVGEIGELYADLIDENLKGLDDWFERQRRYARAEAKFELEQEARSPAALSLFASDPLVRRAALKHLASRAPGRAITYFLYSYLLRGGYRDGRDGLVFCTMRALFQQLVVIEKYDMLRKREDQ